MNRPSFLPAANYDALKAAFRTLLQATGGAVRAAREIVRVDPARLSRYGARHEASYPPIDVIADLEAEAGEPIVTRVLADLCGFVLIPKPGAKGDPDWLRCASGVIRECAELSGAIGAALAEGGTISEQEAVQIARQARKAMEQLAAVEQAALRIMGSDAVRPASVEALRG